MRTFLFLVLGLALSVMPLSAAEIGVIDLQKALNMSNAGAAAKAEIEAFAKKAQAELNAEQVALQKMKNELETQAVLLSDEAKAQKEREFKQRAKEFQRKGNDTKEQLQQRDADLTRKIIAEIRQIVETLGKEKGFTAIFEKSQSGLVYSDRGADLTDEVIKRYNKQK